MERCKEGSGGFVYTWVRSGGVRVGGDEGLVVYEFMDDIEGVSILEESVGE